VRLKGPPGNPCGVGAAIRLSFEGHVGPVHEVHAGSGYWSQDSAVLVPGVPQSPRYISVLWPGGKRSRAAVPAGAREVAVDH
jgi:hypothetical protein